MKITASVSNIVETPKIYTRTEMLNESGIYQIERNLFSDEFFIVDNQKLIHFNKKYGSLCGVEKNGHYESYRFVKYNGVLTLNISN